jgi:hypothetical protein
LSGFGVGLVNINLRDYKDDPNSSCWELPVWGHPISTTVMPLFYSTDEHIFPIGTAFMVGGKVGFVFTAQHNILEAIKKDYNLETMAIEETLPNEVSMANVGLYVLHSNATEGGNISLTLVPLENVTGGPPTDIAIASPKFVKDLPRLDLLIGFNLPLEDETVLSVGYCEFDCPESGIPIKKIEDGTFDWISEYSHRLQVVEAKVKDIFTQRFSNRFVGGPCFTIDQTISHGQSGGPVFSEDGNIIGINSAGADMFYNSPSSIVSQIYPLVLSNIKFGLQMGVVRMNAKHQILDMIAFGAIKTDGSETHLSFYTDSKSGKQAISQRGLVSASNIYDNFDGYQNGIKGTPLKEQSYSIKYIKNNKDV